MAFRRASLNSLPPAADQGIPYQIFTEVVDTGKNLAGSKTKVKWLFGYSNSDLEHCIEFKISYLTGNKRIYSDGKEIYSGGSLLETEFSHGWSQDNHFFRVDCVLGLTTENTYILLIDSVKYNDLNTKSGLPRDCIALNPTSNPTPSSVKGFGNSNDNNTNNNVHRRASTGSSGSSNTNTTTTNNNNNTNASIKSNNNNNNNTFDAFGTTSVDPFSTSNNNNNNTFDPFGTTNTTTTNTNTNNNNTFDPFGRTTTTTKITTTITNNNNTFDPFGTSTINTTSNTNSTNNNNTFDPFGTTTTTTTKSTTNSVIDLFNTPVNNVTNDPFAPQPPKIQNITNGLSNISFVPPPTGPNNNNNNSNNNNNNNDIANVTPKKDNYGGLVNLDLSNTNNTNNTPTRRSSLTDASNPPLNSMMNNNNNNNNNGRPVSMAVPMNTGNNPFANNMNNVNQNTGGRPQSMNMRGNPQNVMYNTQITGTQQKNSLDSLNWKI